MRKSLKKVAASAMAAALALTVVAGVGNTASAAPAAFDPNGTYKASIGFEQTGTWRHHGEITNEDNGLNGADVKKAGLNYETDVMRAHDGLEKINGVVEGVELKGNGTYTVKIKDLNGALEEVPDDCNSSDIKMSMVFLTTNLPADAKDKVQFSDVSFKVDGNTISLPEEQFFKPETLQKGYISLYVLDTYAKEQGEYPDSPELAMQPHDSMEITFTVSGFANDNPDAVPATPTPEPEKKDVKSDDKGGSPVNAGVVAGIVVAVVVIAGVVVVVSKKKK